MKLALLAHPRKPRALELLRFAVELVGGRAELVVASDGPADESVDLPTRPIEQVDADVVVAVGGDGTFLQAARRTETPILPINAGTVGVLAEIDGNRPEAFRAAIDRLLSGEYRIEERSKLSARVGETLLPDAVNEVVVHAARVGRMGEFALDVDGRPAGRLRADGLVLATPTGSTGYALSVGGPIVDPAIDAIVLVAIAPFRLPGRAVLVDPLSALTVRPLSTAPGTLVLVDGGREVEVPVGGSVLVYRSARRARFVRFGLRFFDRLRDKRILPWEDEPVAPNGRSDDVPTSA